MLLREYIVVDLFLCLLLIDFIFSLYFTIIKCPIDKWGALPVSFSNNNSNTGGLNIFVDMFLVSYAHL